LKAIKNNRFLRSRKTKVFLTFKMRREKIIGRVEEKIIKMAIEIAKEKEGALFVIVTGKSPKYALLVKQTVNQFNILDRRDDKLLKSLAKIDGAVLISKSGIMLAYGAMIKSNKIYKGFGTRHAAAISASQYKNICILVSEEQQKIKLFRNGKYLMQIDALEKDIEKRITKITELFETFGAGLIGTIGASVLVPALGVALIPGVIIFGGGYYALKKIINKVKEK
jgi:DNA integrity scanning protein DisA with diadenylate cyclase activity